MWPVPIMAVFIISSFLWPGLIPVKRVKRRYGLRIMNKMVKLFDDYPQNIPDGPTWI